MRKIFLAALLATLMPVLAVAQKTKPDTLWFKYNDPFIANEYLPLDDVDSIEFTKTSIKRWKTLSTTGKPTGISKSYFKDGEYRLGEIERYLAKPSGYNNCDYTKTTSQWCFQRSMESEHFICFWENGMTKNSSHNITYDGYTLNVKTLLNNAEKIFDVYVNQLGFLVPGKSVTDNTKIHMYIVKKSWDGSDWRADGSGQDGVSWYYEGTTKRQKSTPVGLFHCTTRAATGRNGHTPAHEIGHVFQYLVSADLGQSHGLNYGFGPNTSGGNEWWEDCANWQAYKVYPSMQFSDGEYFEQYMGKHHLNIHHEDSRYTNCFYHDWWCMLHGMNTIGRVWRESKKPEDPTEAYMRIFGLDIDAFADEQFEGYMRFTSIDVDGVRNYGKQKIGYEPQRLIEPSDIIVANYLGGDDSYWVVDPSYCPQNFGYNANPLKVPAAGTVVKANFKGIVDAPVYRKINTQYAGWRYGIAAYCNDGTRVYSEIGRGKEGEVSITVPEKCTHMWFVVMGAPTHYWRHAWDDDIANDEQWPYAVKFEGTDPLGVNRTYGAFPDDYERKDTTVVINANLAYSSSNWSYVRVQLDMDAISQALGVSTAQLTSAVCGKKSASAYPYVRIAGLNANGTTETNSKTISDTDVIFGHWFSTAGNVQSGLNGSAAIYTKIYHDKYSCYVGQNPGKLTKGKTYVVREAIIYTHTDGKEYKAIMEIHLNVI